jgi:hypothetical protein
MGPGLPARGREHARRETGFRLVNVQQICPWLLDFARLGSLRQAEHPDPDVVREPMGKRSFIPVDRLSLSDGLINTFQLRELCASALEVLGRVSCEPVAGTATNPERLRSKTIETVPSIEAIPGCIDEVLLGNRPPNRVD